MLKTIVVKTEMQKKMIKKFLYFKLYIVPLLSADYCLVAGRLFYNLPDSQVTNKEVHTNATVLSKQIKIVNQLNAKQVKSTI